MGNAALTHPTGAARICAGGEARVPKKTGVEVAREHGLADVVGLTEPLDLGRLERRRGGQAGFIELAHRCLIDRSHTQHARNAAMDRL